MHPRKAILHLVSSKDLPRWQCANDSIASRRREIERLVHIRRKPKTRSTRISNRRFSLWLDMHTIKWLMLITWHWHHVKILTNLEYEESRMVWVTTAACKLLWGDHVASQLIQASTHRQEAIRNGRRRRVNGYKHFEHGSGVIGTLRVRIPFWPHAGWERAMLEFQDAFCEARSLCGGQSVSHDLSSLELPHLPSFSYIASVVLYQVVWHKTDTLDYIRDGYLATVANDHAR
jgi:hypothetical protein